MVHNIRDLFNVSDLDFYFLKEFILNLINPKYYTKNSVVEINKRIFNYKIIKHE